MKSRKTKELEKYIESAIKRYYNSNENIEFIHDRLDELFLLWSSLYKINFIKTCEKFGLRYREFSEHIHYQTKLDILNKFPELRFEKL